MAHMPPTFRNNLAAGRNTMNLVDVVVLVDDFVGGRKWVKW